MRAITIATTDYLANTRRLATSFRRHHPHGSLTLYCDDRAAALRYVGGAGCEIVELPEIRSLGVKRAKFTAYRHAIAGGSFLYLDSDIIVLDCLDELVDDTHLVAAPDEFAECAVLPDKRHLWPNAPELEAVISFNSGVVFFPRSLAGFVERMEVAARSKALYTQYSFEPWLSDNLFLLAFANLERTPFRSVDSGVFNWQGFRRGHDILIACRSGQIVNRETGRPLKLMHFAGIGDIDGVLFGLDNPTLQAISRHIADAPLDPLTVVETAQTDPSIVEARTQFARALLPSSRTGGAANAPTAYVPNPRALVDIAMATRPSPVVWNGLPCGAAYLDADEYYWLRDILQRLHPSSILEFGAGYTSMLFKRLGLSALSIEASPGPWLIHAMAAGCPVETVAFDPTTRSFDGEALASAVDRHGMRAPDLLFIDSPVGTANRRGVLAQAMAIARPRYILFHDAFRDVEIVYGALHGGHFRVEADLPSIRGIVLLARHDSPPIPRRQARPIPTEMSRRAFVAEIADDPPVQLGKTFLQRIRLKNLGSATWRPTGERLVNLSYHVVSAEGAVKRWDNRRTTLPCPVEPGDELLLDLAIDAVEGECGELFYRVDVVREGKGWFFEEGDSSSPLQPMPGKPAAGSASPLSGTFEEGRVVG